MSSSPKAVYRLTALDDFRCLAGDCPDTCCANWTVEVESSTRARWQTLPVAARERLNASVDGSPSAADGTGTLRRTAGGECVHLAADRMCEIQRQHGHDYLPGTCRHFPRLDCNAPSRRYLSASLSCPDIARRVLSAAPGRPLFVRDAQRLDTVEDRSEGTMIGGSLAELVDAVMDTDAYRLRTRIALLTETLARAAHLSGIGRLEPVQLQALCDRPRDRLQAIDARLELQPNPAPPSRRRQFWSWLLAVARQRGVQFPAGAEEIAAEPASAPDTAPELFPGHTAASRLIDARYRRAMGAYLATSLANHGFPTAPYAGNHVATYLQALLPYAATQLYLWARIRLDGTLNDEDVWRAAQHVERRFAHSTGLYELFERQPGLLRLDTYLAVFADL